MRTARTFIRLAFAGLFVNALAVACVASDNDGDDDNSPCEQGDSRDCTCPDGSGSERRCNASGTGFGSCVCDGSSSGGSDSGTSCEQGDSRACTCPDGTESERHCNASGTGFGNCVCDSASAGSGSGGTNSNAGEGNLPAAGASGESGGGTGGAGGGSAGAGGAGGATDPGLCAEDPTDSCADCYQQGCCEEWTACVEDEVDDGEGDCATQFLGIIACAEALRVDAAVSKADVIQCAEDQVDGGSAWSSGLRPTVKPLIDCVGGGEGWDTDGMGWSDLSCKNNCFSEL